MHNKQNNILELMHSTYGCLHEFDWSVFHIVVKNQGLHLYERKIIVNQDTISIHVHVCAQ